MGRIPEEELEQIKQGLDLAELVRSGGIELKPQGKDLVGRCPLHAGDDTPSLVITPGKALWHCFGCNAGGDVIEWVRRLQGLSFRHAVEVCKEILGRGSAGELSQPRTWAITGLPPKSSSVRRLPSPVEASAADHELLLQVVDYYHATLQTSPQALAYLAKRCIGSAEVIDRFSLGYANRTLGLRLPSSVTEAGRRIRARLTALGILRENGREHLNGSVVVTIFDAEGRVAQMYGRKITPNLRADTVLHLYLPGPLRGVWNLPGLQGSKEIILCEALIDALSFVHAGFANVTASFGAGGFTADMLDAFKAAGTERVLIAYDNDDAGNKGAEAVAARLAEVGITSFRVRFPHHVDANLYACKVQPAGQALALLLRSADYMAGPIVQRPLPVARDPLPATTQQSSSLAAVASPAPADQPPEPGDRPEPASSLAAVASAAPAGPLERGQPVEPLEPAGADVAGEEAEPIDVSAMVDLVEEDQPETPAPPALAPRPTPPPTRSTQPPAPLPTPPPAASPIPPSPAADIPAEVSEHQVVLRLGERTWRVRGLAKNLSFEAMRVNLFVALVGHLERFHQDTLDLYAAKQRQAFARTAAVELGINEDLVKKDLGMVLLKIEALQEDAIKKTLEAKPQPVAMSAADRDAALELLKDPRLLERILADFERCGVVGEETNKLVGYLAAVSRKLDHPLAALVQSSSAAGKSALMNAVLAFVPDEERVAYSAMTGQSLFYMGERDLTHKLLAIAEEEGAQRASYALKQLQSEGRLSIISTGKDPTTGKLVAHEYNVEGPAAIFMTTTAIDLDEELLNRCLVLTVDEDREQTRAIHRIQRQSQTLEGLLSRRRRGAILALHHNAQRLLQPLPIFNPYAGELTFLDDKTRMRRDHLKYLGLIEVVTLLHQHQRERRTFSDGADTMEYLVTHLTDIETANRLAAEVLGHTLDELPPQTRRFLLSLDALVGEIARTTVTARSEIRFTARQAREHSGWRGTQVKIHLARLVEEEYVLIHRGSRGQSFVYELLWSGEGADGTPFLMGLLDVERLRTQRPPSYGAERSASQAGWSEEKPGWSGSKPKRSGPGRASVGGWSGGGRTPQDPQKPNQEAPSEGTNQESPEKPLLENPEKPPVVAKPRRTPGDDRQEAGAATRETDQDPQEEPEPDDEDDGAKLLSLAAGSSFRR